MHWDEHKETAIFLDKTIKEVCGFTQPSQIKVLDFGCGSGTLISNFLSLDYDAYGCDVGQYWQENSLVDPTRFAQISFTPYKIPFDDNTFDIVVSTSVLEHAQNKEEFFNEIFRVLKAGGCAIHILPGKWYLPYEPHIFVPLVNFFWPYCPKWWLGLWAFLGVRNQYQHGLSWKKVFENNQAFCLNSISYWSNKKYRDISFKIFGNYLEPAVFYIENSHGNFAKLARKFPFNRFSGWLTKQIRMYLFIQKKTKE